LIGAEVGLIDENGFDVPTLDHPPVVSGPPGPFPRR
jgi:hypothetical protein